MPDGIVLPCEWCRATFEPGNYQHKRFCSETCRSKAERERTWYTTSECAWCGKACRQRKHDVARYPKAFCDRSCAATYRACVQRGQSASAWPKTQPCTECGERYPTRSKARAKCPDCYRAWQAGQLVDVTCIDCGVTERAAPQRKRCQACKRARRSRSKDNRHLKRRAYIIERDKGRCRSCKAKVRLGDPLHPRAAEIDHVIPRAHWPAGQPGLNDPANLQLLCRTCNLGKSDGTLPHGDQLALLG